VSKREVFSRTAEPMDLFSALTAEAWMDPDLAAELRRDKAVTVARFAKKHGFALPAGDAVEAFELPENPVGELKLTTPDVNMAYTDYTCQTACSPCATEVTCLSECGGCETQNLCSSGCPTEFCTQGCSG
jgi:hypothetical protein